VTLDIEMPHMTGLEFLEKIMRLRPMPVIMVSTLTKRGADETIAALEMGAVDCVEKPRSGNENTFRELPAIVKAARQARVRALSRPVNGHAESNMRGNAVPFQSDGNVVAIGASTGGVEALIEVISNFPENCPPTLITQHMPPTFTTSFAQRLDRATPAEVREAFDGAVLEEGKVYLAPGGSAHLEVAKAGSVLKCRLKTGERVNGHCPSVDVLFRSVAAVCREKSIGVILTGMGRDGADGLLAMRTSGARTIGQDEGTSVVYGMPRAAFELGAVQKQLALDRIGTAILSGTSLKERR